MRMRRFGPLRRCAGLTAAALLMIGLGAPASVDAQSQTPAPGKTLSLGVAESGVVGKILVQDGAHVEAGQILMQLDCRPLELEIKARAADRDAAEAGYERTRNGPRPDEIEIGRANVGVAQARSEESEDAYTRLKGLTEGVSVTRAQLLEGRRDARVTAAQLEDSRKRLALLLAGSREEDVAEALARRDAAAAEFEEAEAWLERCTLRAPAPGIVEVVATLGQFFSTSVPATLLRLTLDRSAK